jgi:hypothetical protein
MVSGDSRGTLPHCLSGLTMINNPVIDLTMNNNKYLLDILHCNRYTASTRIQYKGTDELWYIPTHTEMLM